ncbi:MAG: ABC transporter permease subunit [Clostridia bacterium]|nr:ABC transporter permease subunit [Clostridia bacterium]
MKLVKPQTKAYSLILRYLLFLLMFIGYGVFELFSQSFEDAHDQALGSLGNYELLFSNQYFWDSLLTSINITFSSTIISIVLGVVLARLIYFYLHQSKWKYLIWIPMLIPHFVAGHLILLFFSQSGLISRAFYNLRWINHMSQFPGVVNDPWGIGIILTYIWKEVPFVVLMVLPAYYRQNKQYIDVVRTLGGSKWQVFKMVEWPALYPIVIETALILWAFVITAYEIPYLLGVTYPKMLSVLAYQWFYQGDWSSRPIAMALFSVLTVFILMITFGCFRLTQSGRFRSMRGR